MKVLFFFFFLKEFGLLISSKKDRESREEMTADSWRERVICILKKVQFFQVKKLFLDQYVAFVQTCSATQVFGSLSKPRPSLLFAEMFTQIR